MLRIGVIGAGAFSKYTLTAYKNYLQGAEVRAITSRTLSKAEALAEALEIPLVKPDNSALMSDPDIDIILILTPPLTHYDLTMEALSRGKHVLVDKPVVFTEKAMKDIIDMAEKKELHIATNLVLRVHPFHQRIRDIRRRGDMGRLLQIITSAMLARYPDDHWYWQPEVSGGFYLNTFSHFLDLFDFIAGERPTPVQAQGDPDHGYFLAGSYPSGALTSLAVNLQVSNSNERVHSSYIFERGLIETQGWMPDRLEIRPEGAGVEIVESGPKDEEYQKCLADIMNMLVQTINGTITEQEAPVNRSIVADSVNVPLMFSNCSS